jgi:hypothetical protein
LVGPSGRTRPHRGFLTAPTWIRFWRRNKMCILSGSYMVAKIQRLPACLANPNIVCGSSLDKLLVSCLLSDPACHSAPRKPSRSETLYMWGATRASFQTPAFKLKLSPSESDSSHCYIIRFPAILIPLVKLDI